MLPPTTLLQEEIYGANSDGSHLHSHSYSHSHFAWSYIHVSAVGPQPHHSRTTRIYAKMRSAFSKTSGATVQVMRTPSTSMITWMLVDACAASIRALLRARGSACEGRVYIERGAFLPVVWVLRVCGCGCQRAGCASFLTVPSTMELVTIKKSEAEIANASTVAASKATTRRKPAATTATASIEAFRVRDQGRVGTRPRSKLRRAQGARRALTYSAERKGDAGLVS